MDVISVCESSFLYFFYGGGYRCTTANRLIETRGILLQSKWIDIFQILEYLVLIIKAIRSTLRIGLYYFGMFSREKIKQKINLVENKFSVHVTFTSSFLLHAITLKNIYKWIIFEYKHLKSALSFTLKIFQYKHSIRTACVLFYETYNYTFYYIYQMDTFWLQQLYKIYALKSFARD